MPQHFSDDLTDVILHCDGSHFTLLQLSKTGALPGLNSESNPYEYVSDRGNLTSILLEAKNSGLLVNIVNTEEKSGSRSLTSILGKLLKISTDR